jgi:hypothetical protein
MIIILDALLVDSDVWIIIYNHGISTGLKIVLYSLFTLIQNLAHVWYSLK